MCSKAVGRRTRWASEVVYKNYTRLVIECTHAHEFVSVREATTMVSGDVFVDSEGGEEDGGDRKHGIKRLIMVNSEEEESQMSSNWATQ